MRKQYVTCVRPHVLHTHWDQRMMYYEALILSLSVFFFMKPFLGFKAALFWNTVLNQTWKAAYSACLSRTEQLFRKGAVCFDIERNERKIKWREAIMRYSGCMPAPRGHVWGEAFMYLENTPGTHNNICVYGIENKTLFTRFNPEDFLWLRRCFAECSPATTNANGDQKWQKESQKKHNNSDNNDYYLKCFRSMSNVLDGIVWKWRFLRVSLLCVD